MRLDKTGISGVIAATGLLVVFIVASYAVIFMMHRMTGISPSSLGYFEGAQKRGEELSVVIYNMSLCDHLMRREYTHQDWRIAIINTGSVPVTIDKVVIVKGGKKIYELPELPKTLNPAEFIVKKFAGKGQKMVDAIVYVHTASGSIFTGAYGIPDAYALVKINPNGKCVEPLG